MDILKDSTFEKIEFSLSETVWLFFFNIFCGCFYKTECTKEFICLTER